MKDTNRVFAWVRACAPAMLLAVGAATVGCDKKIIPVVSLANQLPQVEITQAPMDTTVTCQPSSLQSCYLVTVYWTGFDPDGQIDHYQVAVDPPSEAGRDTAWETTRANQHRMLLTARQPLPQSGVELPMARDFHVFVLRAVDNLGAAGPFEARAFFTFTQAPSVLVIRPRPSDLLVQTVAPNVRITWSGNDEDGVLSRQPVKYKYLLLNPSSNISPADAAHDPDLLRRTFAPTFAGWDSVDGGTTTVQFTNLSPDQEYLFAVVAFDEAGAYSPIFRIDTNLLRFKVGFASLLGPTITASSEFFQFTWRPSYCPTCVTSQFFVEMPAEQRVTVNWSAVPPYGGDMRSYRWALDIVDIEDPTPRRDDQDFRHWSEPGLNVNSAIIGPFAVGSTQTEERMFYIEARDNLGLKSLAIIRLLVVPANFRPGSVLIVKDVRFTPDQMDRNTGCVEKPKGKWPTYAELDTFLFARGGVQWRCYPRDTLSRRGLFYGYAFDTLGTRTRKNDLTVRLSTLSRYQHVIWVVDQTSANLDNDGSHPISPQTALRYMSGTGRFNSLYAYVRLGGKVWLVGGGGGYATTIPYNSSSNDVPTVKFSAVPTHELAPGRFIYDLAGWRSEISVFSGGVLLKRYAGRHEAAADPELPYTSRLGELPRQLDLRTLSSDPLPPYRTTGEYNISDTKIEFLQTPNLLLVDIDPDPERELLVSGLDTLFEAAGGGLPRPNENPHNVIMTYAHGPKLPQGFIETGFDLWSFKRSQIKPLVDFVLRRMWNLDPNAVIAPARSASEARAAAAKPPGARSLEGPAPRDPAKSGRPGIRRPARPASAVGNP